MILLSSFPFNMFRNDNAIFMEYMRSLKPIKVRWIIFINFNWFYAWRILPKHSTVLSEHFEIKRWLWYHVMWVRVVGTLKYIRYESAKLNRNWPKEVSLNREGRMILRSFLKESCVRVSIGFNWLVIEQVSDYCGHCKPTGVLASP